MAAFIWDVMPNLISKTRFPGVHESRMGKRRLLLTRNLVPGQTVYTEQLISENNVEYRTWDPRKSKLAAAILKGLNQIGIKEKDFVLYLGAATGTTVSHISDIIGKNGCVFAVDSSPRVVRELVYLAEKRKNIVPILADANQPETYFSRIIQADFMYQDIAQRNQSEIFIKNLAFLKKDAFCILCVKARSIDMAKRPSQVFRQVRAEIEKKLTIVDYRELRPFQKDHCLFVCKKS